eukprot:scaffold47396_cov67-Phaeocystis_antarctica.AAC.3
MRNGLCEKYEENRVRCCGTSLHAGRNWLSPPEQGAAPQPARSAWPPPRAPPLSGWGAAHTPKHPDAAHPAP